MLEGYHVFVGGVFGVDKFFWVFGFFCVWVSVGFFVAAWWCGVWLVAVSVFGGGWGRVVWVVGCGWWFVVLCVFEGGANLDELAYSMATLTD